MNHAILIPFLFALGACIGSFLNVVVWRLPRGQSIVSPPSHCPKCKARLKWHDNLPVIGWIHLGGKCRYCREPISPRYPIVEAVTGLLFVFYYVMFFVMHIGPCPQREVMIPHETLGTLKMIPRPLMFATDWEMYFLYMMLISGLVASSLIDWELFIIPIEIPWVLAGLGIVVHAIIDRPTVAGALITTPPAGALALGGAIGLVISILLLRRGIIPLSFPDDEPMQDVDAARRILAAQDEPEKPTPEYTPAQIRAEMRKEMLFLLPPMLLAIAAWVAVTKINAVGRWWAEVMLQNWVGGMMGAILGALVGGLVVWITRILGTLAFGRLAMGLGDVHLMFGVGAIIGAAGSTIAFFLAPFFGIAIAVYMLFSGKKRELPYGPYLSMATAFVLLFSCPIIAWLRPGVMGLSLMLQHVLGGG